MEDQFERIKHVLNEYRDPEAKIAFLLRQIEWLINENILKKK